MSTLSHRKGNLGRRIFASAVASLTIAMSAQAQVVRGTVTDADSGEPLYYATVKVRETKAIFTTNENGEFEIKNLPVGRYTIETTMLGYTPKILQEVLVSSNKDVNLDIAIEEKPNTLGNVTVRPQLSKEMPLNKMVLTGGKMLSVEEASRYAGGLDDPARLVSSFAGVSGSPANNCVSVHGSAPQALVWRMEGVEVFAPNHFSDSYHFGGGSISALSANVLGNSDFLMGAYPAEYGNATGSIFDLKLRNGNNANFEHTVQFGTLGIDAASEGPMGKNSKASYLFNYRYSFTGLALKMGILDLDGDNAEYQDLNFKLNMPTENAGTFSLWGMGYIDKSWVDQDSPNDWETLYDQNNEQVNQKLFTTGLTHKIWLGDGTSLNTTLAASYFFNHIKEDYYEDLGNNTLSPAIPYTDADQTNGRLIANMFVNKKMSKHFTSKLGVNYTHFTYKNKLRYAEEIGQPLELFGNQNENTGLLNIYSSNSWEVNPNFTMNFGINAQGFMLNGDWNVEPRLAWQWRASQRGTLSFGYAMTSRVEKLDVYFVEKEGKKVNQDLDMTRSHQLNLSYLHMLNPHLALRAETFFEYLYDMPIAETGTYALVNRVDYFIDRKLVSKGRGRSYGIDLSLEQYLHKGLFWMVNASLFDTEYRDINHLWHDTRFNTTYAIKALAGKEWMVGKKKQNLLNASVKFSYQGGLRYSPINKGATMANFENNDPDVVYDEDHPFTKQFDPVFTVDFTLSFKINGKKVSHEVALKALNLFQVKSPYKHIYNYKTGQIENYNVGLAMPNVCYRINF